MDSMFKKGGLIICTLCWVTSDIYIQKKAYFYVVLGG